MPAHQCKKGISIKRLQISRQTGRAQGIEFVESPNQDARPDNASVDLLVIHNISLPPNEFGGPYITQLFTNSLRPDDHPYFKDICTLEVSSHFLIRRDGTVIQYVPVTKRAWHAGKSEFCGRQACNNFSIGIELEGADDIPYEDAQYETLVELTRAIQEQFPEITNDHIVGHCDIAPGRKTDPGRSFDWQRYRNALKT